MQKIIYCKTSIFQDYTSSDLYRCINMNTLYKMLFGEKITEDNQKELQIYATDLAECILLDNNNLVIEGEFKNLDKLIKEITETYKREIKFIQK